MTWGQVNKQRLEESMYVVLSKSVGPGGAKRYRFFKFIIQRQGKKPQTREIFMGCHKKNYPRS